MDDWRLYKKGGYWYWDAWDDVNKCWWTSNPFENYDGALIARNSMLSDIYQDEE